MAQPCPWKAASLTRPSAIDAQIDADMVAAQGIIVFEGDVMRVQLAAVERVFITVDDDSRYKSSMAQNLPNISLTLYRASTRRSTSSG